MTATKKDSGRKKLPPLQIGVMENAAIRMVKMVRPICPVPTHSTEKGFDPLKTNCQRENGGAIGWWDTCEKRGHDPYFRARVEPVEVPVWEDREDGTQVLARTEYIKSTERVPNISQVALSERVNSGQGVTTAKQRKGFKFLEDIGYDPVCEFRNCEAPVKIKTVYGRYCGSQHAQLIGADVEHIKLEVGPDSAKKRRTQLRRISLTEQLDYSDAEEADLTGEEV